MLSEFYLYAFEGIDLYCILIRRALDRSYTIRGSNHFLTAVQNSLDGNIVLKLKKALRSIMEYLKHPFLCHFPTI